MKDFLGNELTVGDEVVFIDYEGECFDTDVVSFICDNPPALLLSYNEGRYYCTKVIKVIRQ